MPFKRVRRIKSNSRNFLWFYLLTPLSLLFPHPAEFQNESLESQFCTTHVGIAHTRWATHGQPSELNSHPHRSDDSNAFVVVHNGIVTNYKDIKKFLELQGNHFESETDTEIIAKLINHIYLENPQNSFRELVEQVIQQIVSRGGAAAAGGHVR